MSITAASMLRFFFNIETLLCHKQVHMRNLTLCREIEKKKKGNCTITVRREERGKIQYNTHFVIRIYRGYDCTYYIPIT